MFQSSSIVDVAVSVGMPVYNGGVEFRLALHDIRAQSHQNLEIVISDNCSTDGTHEFCLEQVAKDSRIRYIRQNKNIGGEANVAFVLGEASKAFFFWAAADDRRSPNFVEENLRFLVEHEDYVASTCPIRFEDRDFDLEAMGDSELDMVPERRILKVLHHWHTNGRFYSLYRVSALKDHFVSERYLGSDFATTLAVATIGKYHRTENGWLILGSAGTSMQQESFFASYRGNSLLLYFMPFYMLTKFAMKLTRPFSAAIRFRVFRRLLSWNRSAYHVQNNKHVERADPVAEAARKKRRKRRARIKAMFERLKGYFSEGDAH